MGPRLVGSTPFAGRSGLGLDCVYVVETHNENERNFMKLLLEKAERRSLTETLKLTIYMTLCYYALVGGEEVTRMSGYRILTSDARRRDDLLAKGLIECRFVRATDGVLTVSGGKSFSPMRPNMKFSAKFINIC